MRNFISLVLLGALCSITVAALPGCSRSGSPGKIRVAYVTNGVDPFWSIAKAGASTAARELGVECTVEMPPDGTAPEQKQILEDLLTQGIDGIAVSPINAATQNELIDKTCEKTVVITHDSDAPDSKRLVYIGVDNYNAGRMCGQLVKEALPDGGELMIFVGRLSQDNARLRRQGVIDELMDRSNDPDRFDPQGDVVKNDRYTILGTRTDDFDYSKAKANAEDCLNLHPDVQAMVGLFAYNSPFCLEALKQVGKTGKVKVIAFDEDRRTLAGIRDGTVHGTVVQNPYQYGYESVRVLKAIVDGDRSVIPATGFIDVPARQIRQANLEEFWADLNAKLAAGEK